MKEKERAMDKRNQRNAEKGQRKKYRCTVAVGEQKERLLSRDYAE